MKLTKEQVIHRLRRRIKALEGKHFKKRSRDGFPASCVARGEHAAYCSALRLVQRMDSVRSV